MKIVEEIIRLPRRERRIIFRNARRQNKAIRWEDYRRWDGGRPNILASVDALRIETSNKEIRREMRQAQRGIWKWI